MEVCGPNGFKCDEEKVLNSLLDAFGSAFSLEEIASAYCKANRDADLAGEILVEKQNSSSTSTTNSFGERYPKPKFHPVSAGTVSSRLGKDYVRSMPSASRNYHKTTKPLKLDANLLTMSEIWDEKCEPNNLYHNQLHQDMEDFLFKMLGDGFQLDREKIREVLGTYLLRILDLYSTRAMFLPVIAIVYILHDMLLFAQNKSWFHQVFSIIETSNCY